MLTKQKSEKGISLFPISFPKKKEMKNFGIYGKDP